MTRAGLEAVRGARGDKTGAWLARSRLPAGLSFRSSDAWEFQVAVKLKSDPTSFQSLDENGNDAASSW